LDIDASSIWIGKIDGEGAKAAITGRQISVSSYGVKASSIVFGCM